MTDTTPPPAKRGAWSSSDRPGWCPRTTRPRSWRICRCSRGTRRQSTSSRSRPPRSRAAGSSLRAAGEGPGHRFGCARARPGQVVVGRRDRVDRRVRPGNAGIALDCTTFPVDVADPESVAHLAERWEADLVVIGPELPLVARCGRRRATAGSPVSDRQRQQQLEGSKAFAKEVMAAAGVPTAASVACLTVAEAETALDRFGPTYVVRTTVSPRVRGGGHRRSRRRGGHARQCLLGGGQVVIEGSWTAPRSPCS